MNDLRNDHVLLIERCARIPSFSTREHRIKPFIESIVATVEGASIVQVPDNNLIITVPGDQSKRPIALTAHLDKIDHFMEWGENLLPFKRKFGKIRGQLDDSVGVGVCLHVLLSDHSLDRPPLLILLSELEEHGLYETDKNSQLFNGIGACRISQYLMDSRMIPGLFVTIDTTPQFKGRRGVALYSRFWENCSLRPEEKLIRETEAIERYLLSRFSFLRHINSTNDYINYGMLFNASHDDPVPSIAIEPAIFPCHTEGEEVFLSDIKKCIAVVNHIVATSPRFDNP